MDEGPQSPPAGDGWGVISLMLGGVAVYGGVGWLLDQWFGTGFLVPVGVLGGISAAVFMVYRRF